MKLHLSILMEELRKNGIDVENSQKNEAFIQSAMYARSQEEYGIQDISSILWVFDERNEWLLQALKTQRNEMG